MKKITPKTILSIIGIIVLIIGMVLFFVPPAVFPDPGMGFQVLRCMQLGGSFNVFTSPDQGDISKNYSEFLTWWSPGQYLVPYFFKLATGFSLGKATAITVSIAGFSGLAGFYFFFKKIGFTPLITALSLVFIICQTGFAVPYTFYNGGEVLLFAFEGWFLYGCTALEKPGINLVLFVLLCGWIGFFLKSSFVWIYAAGLCCIWIRLCIGNKVLMEWIKKGFWIGIPAVVSVGLIYLLFLSKGQNPASASSGLKLTAETFSFPIASPILAGFSVDDLFGGLIYHLGKPILSPGWCIMLLVVFAILSLLLIWAIIKYVPNYNYRLFLVVFYGVSILFFGAAFLRQLDISYEGRHFRIIGLLITPGVIYLILNAKKIYQYAFAVVCIILACANVNYMVGGFRMNNNFSGKGVSGLAQPEIDQTSLNKIMKLDSENRNAVFVFMGDDTGLEILHNRIISLLPIEDDLKIDQADYTYKGHAGALYIVLPKSYQGKKADFIMQSFPGYKGFISATLSNNYMLYSAK